MKVLVLGGDGMLGHQVISQLKDSHDVVSTVRRKLEDYSSSLFQRGNTCDLVDCLNYEHVYSIIEAERPEVVINCVGIIKQRKIEAGSAYHQIGLNAFLPQYLNKMCSLLGIRLITVSSDCVFSGKKKSPYELEDTPDDDALYARTKRLGEVEGSPSTVTFRTSFIGKELHRKYSLAEWFVSQEGEVPGFTKAIWSGLTTIEFSRVIQKTIEDWPSLHGLWQVAGHSPISKYDLLKLLQTFMTDKERTLVENTNLEIDRSISGSAFEERTGYKPPDWPETLEELAYVLGD